MYHFVTRLAPCHWKCSGLPEATYGPSLASLSCGCGGACTVGIAILPRHSVIEFQDSGSACRQALFLHNPATRSRMFIMNTNEESVANVVCMLSAV